MRTIISAAAVALTLVATSATAANAQAAGRFAYIDSRAVMQQAPGRAEAEAQFEREVGNFRQQVQRMGDSLNALVAEYSRQEATLSPAVRETRQREIQQREEEYEQRVRQLEQQVQQRQMQLVGPIMERINQVINQVRDEGGYAFIFDVGAQGNPIVAADRNLDITDQVVARLRATAGAQGTRPDTSAPRGATNPAPAGVSRPRNPR